MSEMQTNKGIIKELYPELKTLKEKVEALMRDRNLTAKELDWDEDADYIYHDEYESIGDRLFDKSQAPDEYDNDDDMDEITKIGPYEYRVAFRYYNGGCNFGEMLESVIDRADKEYEEQAKAPVYYAIKRSDGSFVDGPGNSYLSTPRLYHSEKNARNAVERHWPGIVSEGYTIVPFREVK